MATARENKGNTQVIKVPEKTTGVPCSPSLEQMEMHYRCLEEAQLMGEHLQIFMGTLTFKDYPYEKEFKAAWKYYAQKTTRYFKNYEKQGELEENQNPWRPAPWCRPLLVGMPERGKKGRLHYHCLLYVPYPFKLWQFEEKALKWPYGFQKWKRVRTKTEQRAIRYVVKYTAKEGRIRCSYNFGLTTTISLLSNSSFKLLAMAHIRTAQRLLQRLSLASNYPTSRKLTSLISQDRYSTTLRQRNLVELHRPKMIGDTYSAPVSFNFSDGSLPAFLDCTRKERSKAVKKLVRQTVRDLRWFATHGSPTTKLFIACALPGLQSFGKLGRKTIFSAEGSKVRDWLTYHRHPTLRKLRSRKV